MTTPTSGSRLAVLPDELFGPGPALAPQWLAQDGKGLLEGGRGPQPKPSRQTEDRPWRGQDDKGGDSWTGGGGGLQGLRGPVDTGMRPRWREDERQAGLRRPEPRRGGQDHDGMRCAKNNPQRSPAESSGLVGSPMDRWGGEAGRGRSRGPPGPSPPPARWGPPGPERHQQPDRWGGPVAPEAGRRDKWDKWTPLEGGPKEPHILHDDKWRPPYAGFGSGPSMRDAPGSGYNPGFGPPGGHAVSEHRGEPTPAGTGRGFAIGRGRGPSGPARAPGADSSRWGATYSHAPAVGQEPVADGKTPSKADPPQSLGSKANAKYQRGEMEAVFYQLHAKHALRLPAGVSQDDPALFAVSGQPTVHEILQNVNHGRTPAEDKLAMPETPAAAADLKGPALSTPAASSTTAAGQTQQHSDAASRTPSGSAAGTSPDPAADRQQDRSQQPATSPFATTPPDAPASVSSAVPAPHEHLQDTWVYRDPNWEVQGPFSKADILDWYEGGYFPADLPIKHASSPQADFKPLAAQINIWAAAAPPGFARQEPQNSIPAAAQPATAAQQAPMEQQPLSGAASGFQAQQQQQQQQPRLDMNRAFTLTSADSGLPAQHTGPSTASSTRLDALETGSNQFSAAQPAPAASGAAGMDLLNQLLTGIGSGASSTALARPAPAQGQAPLMHFPGLQQGASAAAPWGHQTQPGPAPSGQFNSDSPLLGLVTGLGQDPFEQRQFSQAPQHPPPQQHALPAFLMDANHMQERSSSLSNKGIFGQAYVAHTSANLDHINLGSAGLNLQPHQQQWAAQMQTPDPTFGMRRPEQQQQPETPNQGNEFARMLQRANMPPQQQQPSHQQRPPQQLPQSPVISQIDQAVPKPQPSPKVQESAVEKHPARPAVTQPAQEQEAVSDRKHRPAPPRKAAPGPASPPAPAPAPSITPAWAMPKQHQPSLAGVQLEQQLQQQQQQQQQVHDWAVTPEAPASPKKAEPKAPWGAAKPLGPVGGNLQDVMREEELAAAAARAAQPAVSDVKTTAPGAARASGWACVTAGSTPTKGRSLKEIQDEEERARRSEQRQQQQQHTQQQPDQPGGFSLRDSFVGGAQALLGPKMAPWAAAAGRHHEESAADLEGGDPTYHQDHFSQPPPPPPRKPAAKEEKKKTPQELKREQVEEQRRAAAAARQELKEEKKPKQTAAGPAPSMALRTAASLQRVLSNGDDDGMFWDYGQAAGLRTGNSTVPPASLAKQAVQPNGRAVAGQQWQPPQTTPAPFSAKPLPQDLPATETVKMSSELRTWASQQIRSLSKGRIDDPSVLLDVLMDTPSNGEVVEGCLVNIERNGNVSAFATEFIRRKAAELAGGSKSKSKAKTTGTVPPAGIAPGSSSATFAGPPSAAAASDAAKFQKVPKANKGKKGKPGKGQKVDSNMLGFSNKMDFNVLQSGDNYN